MFTVKRLHWLIDYKSQVPKPFLCWTCYSPSRLNLLTSWVLYFSPLSLPIFLVGIQKQCQCKVSCSGTHYSSYYSSHPLWIRSGSTLLTNRPTLLFQLGLLLCPLPLQKLPNNWDPINARKSTAILSFSFAWRERYVNNIVIVSVKMIACSGLTFE